MRIASMIAALLAWPLLAAANQSGSPEPALTFLTGDGKTLIPIRCMQPDGHPGLWKFIADGVLDKTSFLATSLVPIQQSSVVQCTDYKGGDGTFDAVMPPNDVIAAGSRITYIDIVTISLPKTIHSLQVGGESVHVRSSRRGVILALPSFIQVFPADAVLDVSVRNQVVIDQPGFGAARAQTTAHGTCSVAYINEDGKQALVKKANNTCLDLLYQTNADEAIFSKTI